MLQFIKPFYKLVALTLMLTFLVVVFEAVTLWFSGSLLNMIFKSSEELTAIDKPEFSLANINELLKYHTWNLLSNGGRDNTLGVLKRICILIPILFALKDGFLYIRRVMMSVLNLNVIEKMRVSFYKHIMALPIPFYDKNKTGSVTSYLIQDLNIIQSTLSNSVNLLIMEPLKLVFFFGLLLIINFKLTLLILVSYPLIAFVLGKAGKLIKKRSSHMLASFSDIVSMISETVGGVRLVKTFHGENYEQKKFEKVNKVYTQKSLKANMITFALSPFNEFVSLTLTSALIWYGGKEVLSPDSTFSSDDFLRFLIILFSAYTPIKKLVDVHASMQVGISASERVFKIFDIETEEISDDSCNIEFKNELQCQSISFSYPEHEEVVLKDISFTVKKGEVVALVGSSGSGKSTILDLIPRFYEIEHGEISLDGTNTKELSLYNLRSLFGIVSQDTILFDDSILANIAYGSETPDIKRVKEAINAANAKEFIDKLPQGLETVIGERGVTLSGGQRQRLAIARALYKNPAILILDEATSALDTESEKIVQEAIDNLIKDRTTLVVAHRLSTIQKADTILVLDNGRIVERGNHHDLLAACGRYKELYEIQFGAGSHE